MNSKKPTIPSTKPTQPAKVVQPSTTKPVTKTAPAVKTTPSSNPMKPIQNISSSKKNVWTNKKG